MAKSYVTTTGRRLFSILVGSALGGALSLAGMLLLPGASVAFQNNGNVVVLILASYVFLGFVWLLGISLVGLPVWLWVEQTRTLSWRMATIGGAAFGPVISLIVLGLLWTISVASMGTDEAWYYWRNSVKPMAILTTGCSVIGCFVGSAMWRVAYRRTVSPNLAETFS